MADQPLVSHTPPPIGAVTVSGGLSRSEVESIVASKINSLPAPAPAVDESKIRSIVQTEVAKIPQNPGVSETKVQELIHSAVAQQSGVSEEQVNTIVQAAISKLPTPQESLSEQQVNGLIQAAIAALPAPEKGLSEEQVNTIVQKAIAAIPPASGVDEAKVREIVDGKVPTITDNGDGTITITTKDA